MEFFFPDAIVILQVDIDGAKQLHGNEKHRNEESKRRYENASENKAKRSWGRRNETHPEKVETIAAKEK